MASDADEAFRLPTHDNPYTREEGGLHLVESVLCFLDILGYREMIGAGDEGAQQRFHESLVEAYPLMLAEMGHFPREDPYPQLFALKTFTDNIVVARPIFHEEDGEAELGSIIMASAALQTQLALRGFFVRGGIAVGPAYVDDFGVFGAALLEAYEGEQRLARDPRVVLCASARSRVEQHIGYYHPPEGAPQNSALCLDSDGQAFVNYLEHLAPAPEEGGFGLCELEAHRDMVTEKLSHFAADPLRWAKYEWVARYHNHFCERYDDYCDRSTRIAAEFLHRDFTALR